MIFVKTLIRTSTQYVALMEENYKDGEGQIHDLPSFCFKEAFRQD
jgi:hypothetical protein